MRVRVLWVGKKSDAWAERCCDEYKKRLSRGARAEEQKLKPETFRGDVDAVRHAEGQRILDAVKPRELLVALDERGDALTTEAFSELVQEGMAEGAPTVVFAMGGPYGHDPRVREQAWRVVRLSKMVLNHQIARVMLWEQLYRAWTLQNGIPYHH